MSTHPKKTEINTLMSQILIKIGTYSKCVPKSSNFLFSRKSDKRVESYDPVKFRVDATTRVFQMTVAQKLFHLETSSWCLSFTNWKSFLDISN